jgi:hypothetical protein
VPGPTDPPTAAPGATTADAVAVAVSARHGEASRPELAATLATALHQLVAVESRGLPVERCVGLRASGDAVVSSLRADDRPATTDLDALTDEAVRAVETLDHARNFGEVSRLSAALSVVLSIMTELRRQRR